ncbi:hypothetical protein BgiBS90_025799 [Biomphalaria glabrata]|nr:hypothetical protein BgiBS90_025799 [Biomphalaria glabrata]
MMTPKKAFSVLDHPLFVSESWASAGIQKRRDEYQSVSIIKHLLPESYWFGQRAFGSAREILVRPEKYWLGRRNIGSAEKILVWPVRYLFGRRNIGWAKEKLVRSESYWFGQRAIGSARELLVRPESYWFGQRAIGSARELLVRPESYWFGQRYIRSDREILVRPERYWFESSNLLMRRGDLANGFLAFQTYESEFQWCLGNESLALFKPKSWISNSGWTMVLLLTNPRILN